VDIPRDLPEVFADQDRIQQVIMNLLSNAIKFSSQGGEIQIRAEAFEGKRAGDTSEWIKVSISDQGIGIDEKDFKTIFDKFGQVVTDTLNDKPKGTGLGLPICKEILTHYGGNIWVESKKGKGSTFYFTLPRAVRSEKPVNDTALAEKLTPCENTNLSHGAL
jgi:signal transduction histidine kinase